MSTHFLVVPCQEGRHREGLEVDWRRIKVQHGLEVIEMFVCSRRSGKRV
jgi:hypothetical protein